MNRRMRTNPRLYPSMARAAWEAGALSRATAAFIEPPRSRLPPMGAAEALTMDARRAYLGMADALREWLR